MRCSISGASLFLLAFFTLVFTAHSAEIDWHTYEIDIFADPSTLGVGAIMYDQPTGDCLILHARPEWTLARCNAGGCALERIFTETAGKASPWLLRDAVGIAIAFNNLTEQRIDLARPGEDGWTATPWDVPEACQSIVSLRRRSGDRYGLLCKDADKAVRHAWQTDADWDIEAWPVTAHAQSFDYDADGRPRTAQIVETYDVDDQVYHWWQNAGGEWQSELIYTTSHPVFPLDMSMFAVTDNESHVFLHRNGDTGDSLLHLSGEPGGPWETDNGGAVKSYGWDYYTHVAVGAGGHLGYTYHGFSHVYDKGGDWPEYWSRYASLRLGDLYSSLRSAAGDDDPWWIPHYKGYLDIDEAGQARVLIEDQYFGDGLPPNLYYRHGVEGDEFPLAKSLTFYADTGFSVAAQSVEGGLEPYVFSPFACFPSPGSWTEYFRLYGLTETGWTELSTYAMWPSGTGYPVETAATDDGLHFTYSYNGSPYFLATYQNGEMSYEEILPAMYWMQNNRGTSLEDRANQLLLAFTDNGGSLYFARRPAGGVLGDVQQIPGGAYETAVTACPDGTARLAFRDADDSVRLATEGKSFAIETVDDTTGISGDLGITCEENGTIHIVFTAGADLYHASNTARAWQTELLGQGLTLGDVAPDAQGRPWAIATREATTAALLLHFDGSEWTEEILATDTGEPYTALWSRGDELIACYVPVANIECRSTSPFVPGEPIGDDDDNNNDNNDDNDDNDDNDC